MRYVLSNPARRNPIKAVFPDAKGRGRSYYQVNLDSTDPEELSIVAYKRAAQDAINSVSVNQADARSYLRQLFKENELDFVNELWRFHSEFRRAGGRGERTSALPAYREYDVFSPQKRDAFIRKLRDEMDDKSFVHRDSEGNIVRNRSVLDHFKAYLRELISFRQNEPYSTSPFTTSDGIDVEERSLPVGIEYGSEPEEDWVSIQERKEEEFRQQLVYGEYFRSKNVNQIIEGLPLWWKEHGEEKLLPEPEELLGLPVIDQDEVLFYLALKDQPLDMDSYVYRRFILAKAKVDLALSEVRKRRFKDARALMLHLVYWHAPGTGINCAACRSGSRNWEDHVSPEVVKGISSDWDLGSPEFALEIVKGRRLPAQQETSHFRKLVLVDKNELMRTGGPWIAHVGKYSEGKYRIPLPEYTLRTFHPTAEKGGGADLIERGNRIGPRCPECAVSLAKKKSTYCPVHQCPTCDRLSQVFGNKTPAQVQAELDEAYSHLRQEVVASRQREDRQSEYKDLIAEIRRDPDAVD
jgi:hypothetical protein